MVSKKDGKLLCCKLNAELANLLEQCAKNTGLTKTVIVERALASYLGGGGLAADVKKLDDFLEGFLVAGLPMD